MMFDTIHRFVLAMCIVAITVSPFEVAGAETGAADGGKYKKYVRSSNKKSTLIPLAKFVALRDSVHIQVFSSDSGVVATELYAALDSLHSDGSGFVVSTSGCSVLGQEVAFSSVKKITDSVTRDQGRSIDKIVTVIFWTEDSLSHGKSDRRSGSKALGGEDFSVPQGGFIRGSVLNLKGDVSVDGEVNHSVIAFGDVKIGSSGVVRDHVVALGGSVSIADGSKVYGYIIPDVSGHRVRRPERPWTVEKQRLSFVPSFTYNRVDGFAPRIGWVFTDSDSLLPEMKLSYGFATTSERQRYRFSAKQPLSRSNGLFVRGTIYQELKSDDDDLLPEWQNTLFSLLSTNDYKNYYEALGGSLGLEYEGIEQVSFCVDVYTDELRALRSRRELWSLFGGNRRFYPNYQGIPGSLANSARAEIDGMRSSGVIFEIIAHSKKEFKVRKTHWQVRARAEKTLDGLDSDLSFGRYSLDGSLEKSITKYSEVLVRGQFNASSGDLPLYRKFFLGGYRWLRGFDHKEFLGTESWALALDYGVSFKGAGLGFLKFWMFYDLGQISDNVSLSDRPLLQSIGLGISINDYLRLNIARRLDRSDPSLRLAVEF